MKEKINYKIKIIATIVLILLAVISLITTFILVSYYQIGENDNIYLRIYYFMMVFACNFAIMINIFKLSLPIFKRILNCRM